MKFGELIEAKRVEAGLSANQLSRLLGISCTFLRAVEQGKQQPFLDANERYEKLAILLKVNRADLVLAATREREVLIVPIVTMSDRKLRALLALAALEDDSIMLDRISKYLR